MLSELTQAQKNLMIEVRNEWIKKIERPNDLTVKKVKPHIEWLYEFCGLKKPKILVFDSPFSCQAAAKSISNGDINVMYDVEDRIKTMHWNEVRYRVCDPAFYELWEPVEDQVVGYVWLPLWDQMKEQIWYYYVYPCRCGAISDYNWCSYYDYFTRIGIFNDDDFNRYLEYSNSGIFYSIQLEKVNIVCGNPEHVDRDPSTGKLHSEERMAIQWKDGWGLYFLRGVYFEEDLWRKVTSKTCNLETILSIQNTEQRMAALSLDHNRLLLLNFFSIFHFESDRRGSLTIHDLNECRFKKYGS